MTTPNERLREAADQVLQRHLAKQGFGGSRVETGYFHRRDQLCIDAMLEFASLDRPEREEGEAMAPAGWTPTPADKAWADYVVAAVADITVSEKLKLDIGDAIREERNPAATNDDYATGFNNGLSKARTAAFRVIEAARSLDAEKDGRG